MNIVLQTDLSSNYCIGRPTTDQALHSRSHLCLIRVASIYRPNQVAPLTR